MAVTRHSFICKERYSTPQGSFLERTALWRVSTSECPNEKYKSPASYLLGQRQPMKSALICLNFILSPGHQDAPPQHLLELMKNRIQHQWTQQNPSTSLVFDSTHCDPNGRYWFQDDQIILVPAEKLGIPTLSLGQTALLGGEKLSLPKPVASSTAPQVSHNTLRPQTWPWIISIGALMLLTAWTHQRNDFIADWHRHQRAR